MFFNKLITLLIIVSGCISIDAVPNRIVGGEQAPKGFAPFAVSLRSGLLVTSHFCGGSILTNKYVITAAHCIDIVYSGGSLTSTLRVVTGTNSLNVGGTKESVKRNITHPEWNRNADIKNDIGLLELTKTIAFNELVQSIPLNTKKIGNKVSLTVVGWGARNLGGGTTALLQSLNTSSMGHTECLKLRDENAPLYPGGVPPFISEYEICTFLSVGNATCNGDSGGPLYNSDGLVGLVSWGVPCAKGAPDVFTRVSAYIEWIQPIIST